MQEGKLKGEKKEFPLTLQSYYEKITYDTQQELIDSVAEEFESRQKSKKESESNETIRISDVCWYFGLEDTINLIDERTLDLLQKFQFYKYSPHLIDNPVWYQAYLILDKLEPRMF